ICASGTLGQIIPPSIVLIVLGDAVGSAHQQSQLRAGNFAPEAVSVGVLFVGALILGLVLVLAYIVYLIVIAWVRPSLAPPVPLDDRLHFRDAGVARKVFRILVMPLALIVLVLGSILAGIATPTESASVGCVGAI